MIYGSFDIDIVSTSKFKNTSNEHDSDLNNMKYAPLTEITSNEHDSGFNSMEYASSTQIMLNEHDSSFNSIKSEEGVNSEFNPTQFSPKNIPHGSRLTSERFAAMQIVTGFLSNIEK